MKHIVVWCRTENLGPVVSRLEEWGFVREDTKDPQESQAIGSFVGVQGKMSERFLINLQQDREVSVVEILID